MKKKESLSPITQFHDKIIRLIKEHSSIVWIKTYDFESIDDFFKQLSSKEGCTTSYGEKVTLNRERILTWSVATGQVLFNKSPGSWSSATKLNATLEAFCTHYNEYDEDEDAYIGFQILILKDIFQLLLPGMEDSSLIISQLQNFAHWNNKQCNRKQTIFIVSPVYEKIAGLENLIEIIEDPIPDETDIKKELGFDFFEDEQNGGKRLSKVKRDGKGYEHGRYKYSQAFMLQYNDLNKKLVSSLLGMHLFDIRKVLYSLQVHSRTGRLYPRDNTDYKPLSDKISLEKERIVQNSGLLQVIRIDSDQKEKTGNINKLKELLITQKIIIDNIENYPPNLPKPKGVLLVGAPGCGKSEAAKSIAAILEKPLLRLDIGALMGQYVGVSENNLIEAIRIAEAAQPCVLWIDEIEKAFAGFNNSDSGNDIIVTRMVGYFLTWMQERKSLVYLVATANNLEDLRPELLRKGRWNKIMYLSYPDVTGIIDIFYRCLKKYNLKLRDNFNLDDYKYPTIAERIRKLTIDILSQDGEMKKFIQRIYEQEMSGADIDSMIIDAFNRQFATEGLNLSLSLKTLFEVLNETNTLQLKKDADEELINKGLLNYMISSNRFDLDNDSDEMYQQYMDEYKLSTNNFFMDIPDTDLIEDIMLDIRLSRESITQNEEDRIKKEVKKKIEINKQRELLRKKIIQELLQKKIQTKEREKKQIIDALQKQLTHKSREELEKYYRNKGYESAST